MATTFDITGRINAAVSSGSLNMLKKLQTELRATAKALLKMGETSTANALGHTAMALDRVAGTAGKAAEGAKKLAVEADKTTKRFVRLKGETKQQAEITDKLAKSWKLSGGELVGLTKAVGLLGKKYGYSANMQKEWIPALQNSLTEINKQKAAMVASGKAITAHVTGQELFARTNKKLASGLHVVSGKFTDYDNAMAKSLGRSSAFRKEVDKIAGAVGKQGESFKSQFAALTKADDLWRKHVTNLHRAGEITAKQANKMYAAYDHLRMPLSDLQTQLKGATQKTTLFGRAMSSLVSHLKSFASYAAAASIISGVAGMFGLATRAIVKYDQALHDLQAITRATDAETALMGEKIREIGRTTKFSASEVAVSMRTLGQAGFTASEAISSIGAVADLATGTLTSMKTVVDLVTTAVRAFGMDATETGRVADVFANAVNRSKLTIDKLRVAFNYIGPIAAKAGITFEETNVALMMLANAGIRASTSGTGLRRTIQQLIKPTDELKAAIEAAGYTTEDFNPQFNDMRDIIRRLAEVVPDAESAFRMFSLRSSAAVSALSSQGVASFDALHSAVLRSGSAAEMAEKQIEGLGIIFKQAMDKAHDLALAFGEAGVTGALRVLGKGLQVLFDTLRVLVSSGILKAIVAIGAMSVAIYGLSKAWAAVKLSQWAITLSSFVSQLGLAGGAAHAFGVALASIQAKVGPLLILMTTLYGLYKLQALFLTKVNKVSTDYIDTLDKVHTKELERLESIKRGVSIVRDELGTNRERSNALIKLSKETIGFNLVVDKETGLVENLTGSILEHTDALDEAAASFGKYKEKAELEALEAQVKLFGDAGEALKSLVPKFNLLEKHSEGFFGRMLGGVEAVIDKIPFIGSSYESTAEKLEVYRKGIEALESQQGEAYEKMVKAATSFGAVTQEVWERYMLNAGASSEEVAELFVDGEEKITKAHLEAYLKIQLAREDMTTAEKEALEKHLTLVTDLFAKVNNTTIRRLEKDLKTVREFYNERATIVAASYDEEVANLRGQVGFSYNTYEEINSIIAQKSAERLAIFEQLYEEEKAIIKDSNLGMVAEQERLAELDKKYANRKLNLEKEVSSAILAISEEQFEMLSDVYEQAVVAYDVSVDQRIAAIDRCFEYEKSKAELQIKDAEVLAAKLVDLESQRFDELMAIGEQAALDRLEAEEAYYTQQVELVEGAQEAVEDLFEEGTKKRVKLEKELGDKLVGFSRESTKKRLGILNNWLAHLEGSYDKAIDNSRRYANRIIELENEIRDIRKKAAEAIISATASTEDQILRIRRAGMTEFQLLQSKVQEAYEKMAEANHLVNEVGTTEALKQAKVLYGEAQSIYADLGVKAAGAAKEGKSIGVTHQAAAEAVRRAGDGIIRVLEKEKEASIAARAAELTVANQAQKSWKDLAEEIKVRIGDIQGEISTLSGGIGELFSSINALEDKEVAIGADEAKLNTSIRLVDKLWTNIAALKDKTVTITTRHVEAAQASGPIGEFARGGKLPGFGGGDKIRALLEAGEFVINKSAVRKYGTAMFSAYNSMAAPVISAMTNPLKFAFGGFVGKKLPGFEARSGVGSLRDIEEIIAKLSKTIEALNQASFALSEDGALIGEHSEVPWTVKRVKEPSEAYEVSMPSSLKTLVGDLKVSLDGVKGEDQSVIDEMVALLTPGGIKEKDVRNRLSGRKLPKTEDVESAVLSLEEQKDELERRREALLRYREDLEKVREFMLVAQSVIEEAVGLTATSQPYELRTNEPSKDAKRLIAEAKAQLRQAEPMLTTSMFDLSEIKSKTEAYLDIQDKLATSQLHNRSETGLAYSGVPMLFGHEMAAWVERSTGRRCAASGAYIQDPRFTLSNARLCAPSWELDLLREAENAKFEFDRLLDVTNIGLASEKKEVLRDEVDRYEIAASLGSVADRVRSSFDYGPMVLPNTSSIESALTELLALRETEEGPVSVKKRRKELRKLFETYFDSLPKFAFGGSVSGTGTTDSLLARLTPGEFVLKSDTVRQLGVPFLNALNNFKYPVPAFAGGGLVESAPNNFAQVPQTSGKQTGDVHLQVNITGAGEITEKQVRKWILPAVDKIRRLER